MIGIILTCIGIYNLGVNDGKIASSQDFDLECGYIVYQLVNMQCPEIYDILNEEN